MIRLIDMSGLNVSLALALAHDNMIYTFSLALALAHDETIRLLPLPLPLLTNY